MSMSRIRGSVCRLALAMAVGMFFGNAFADGVVSVREMDAYGHWAVVDFPAQAKETTLLFAINANDRGTDANDWTASGVYKLATVPAGTTSAKVLLPERFRTRYHQGRFFLTEPLNDTAEVDAFYDYIQPTRASATAGSYLRTGIAPAADTEMQLEFALTATSYTQCFFSSRTSSASSDEISFWFIYSSTASSCGLRYDYNAQKSSIYATYAKTGLHRYIMDVKRNSGNMHHYTATSGTIQSISNSGSSTASFTSPEMLLFMSGAPSSGTPTGNAGSWRLYNFKMRDGSSGELLCNYLPAVKDGVAGVYDTVSKTFKSSGNSTYPFTKGAQIDRYLTLAVSESITHQGKYESVFNWLSPYFHVDASYDATLTTVASGGTNWVTKWTDANGGSVYASAASQNTAPFLDAVDGRRVVDFGTYITFYNTDSGRGSSPGGGVGCYLNWSARDSSVREVFLVFADDKAGNHGEYVLTDSTEDDNGYNFARGSDGMLFSSTYASTYIQNGVIELDGETATVSTVPGSGLHLLHLRTTGNVYAGSFANDRSYCRYGGIRYAEVVVLNSTQDSATTAEITRYLTNKWFSTMPRLTVAATNDSATTFTIDGTVTIAPVGTGTTGEVDVYVATSTTEGEYSNYTKIATGLTTGESFSEQLALPQGEFRYWDVLVSNEVNGAHYSGLTVNRLVDESKFDYQTTISVPGYTLSSSCNNFPVLVRISESRIPGFSYALCEADGSDLRFAGADGTLYPHEIDTWNPDGESTVWVGLPTISSSSTFKMYWGGAGKSQGWLPSTDVWVSYVGVWHMNAGTDGARDSTANHLDLTGTDYKGVTSVAKVGYAAQRDKGWLWSECHKITSSHLPQPLRADAFEIMDCLPKAKRRNGRNASSLMCKCANVQAGSCHW